MKLYTERVLNYKKYRVKEVGTLLLGGDNIRQHKTKTIALAKALYAQKTT